MTIPKPTPGVTPLNAARAYLPAPLRPVGTTSNSSPVPTVVEDGPWTAPEGIVQRATAILDAERTKSGHSPATMGSAGSVITATLARLGMLRSEISPLSTPLASLPGASAMLPASLAPSSTPLFPTESIEPAHVHVARTPVRPSEFSEITIRVVNEDDRPISLRFFATPLIGPAGAQIPSEQLAFQPPDLVLGPGTQGDVVMRVHVPARTLPGCYSGLVRASHPQHLHAVVMVPVTAS